MQGLNKLNVISEINKAEPIDKLSNQFQLYKYFQIIQKSVWMKFHMLRVKIPVKNQEVLVIII